VPDEQMRQINQYFDQNTFLCKSHLLLGDSLYFVSKKPGITFLEMFKVVFSNSYAGLLKISFWTLTAFLPFAST